MEWASKKDLLYAPLCFMYAASSLILDWLGFSDAIQTLAWNMVNDMVILFCLMVILFKTGYREKVNYLFWLFVILIHLGMNVRGAFTNYDHTDYVVGFYFVGVTVLMNFVGMINLNIDRKDRIKINENNTQ